MFYVVYVRVRFEGWAVVRCAGGVSPNLIHLGGVGPEPRLDVRFPSPMGQPHVAGTPGGVPSSHSLFQAGSKKRDFLHV